ncbi:MAG: hypothetical protein WC263_02795 [Candidatus Micrarchaeia archaeon]|jgi:hypothetical protein
MVNAYRDVRILQRFASNGKIGNPRARGQAVLVPAAPFHVTPDHRERIFVSVKPGSTAPSQEYLAEYIIRGPCINKALRSIQVLCGEYAKGVDTQKASDLLFNALFAGRLSFKTAIRAIDVLSGLPGATVMGVAAARSPGPGYYSENLRKFVSLVEEGKIYAHLPLEQKAELLERVPSWRNQPFTSP